MDARTCNGEHTVPVCASCHEALSAKQPRMPAHALANGNCLGRHEEILRQMPYAHRLLLPTARVISQRVVFGATQGQDWEKAFKQKGMDGIALVVPQATAETPVFSYPPADLGESFQAIFVGVDPDETTKGLVATVTKKLYSLQASWLQTHNPIVQALKFNEAEVAKWREKQVVETITRCFEEQSAEFAADVDAAGGIGETKYRGPADATSGAQESGEAAENVPYVSLPDTDIEASSDPHALAAVAAEKQEIMKEQAMRIARNEANANGDGGGKMVDRVGRELLKEEAGSWEATAQNIASKISSADKQSRYDQALSNVALVMPTRPGFVKMHEPSFWCKFNPMDFCYGDILHNDPRRETALFRAVLRESASPGGAGVRRVRGRALRGRALRREPLAFALRRAEAARAI